MSAVNEAFARGVELTMMVLLGDKAAAAKQREIRRIVEAVQAGEMTTSEGYERLRFEDGDALDKALGTGPET